MSICFKKELKVIFYSLKLMRHYIVIPESLWALLEKFRNFDVLKEIIRNKMQA
jgi:hypothetical protein